jgi:hypothetical protein
LKRKKAFFKLGKEKVALCTQKSVYCNPYNWTFFQIQNSPTEVHASRSTLDKGLGYTEGKQHGDMGSPPMEGRVQGNGKSSKKDLPIFSIWFCVCVSADGNWSLRVVRLGGVIVCG